MTRNHKKIMTEDATNMILIGKGTLRNDTHIDFIARKFLGDGSPVDRVNVAEVSIIDYPNCSLQDVRQGSQADFLHIWHLKS
jgi:hypothetical protein